jgi:acyl-CoA synthetase (AMP-forming)/AMP-acid ligase II
VEAIQTHGVTMSLGSPLIWKILAEYCQKNDIRLPSLKHIFMFGAAVMPEVVENFTGIMENGIIYTPYGATEALPLTMISGKEILRETARQTYQGAGVCVGQPIGGTVVRIIALSDAPIPKWDDSLALPTGQIGEIVVKGPIVTRQYLHRPQQTAEAKIYDHDGLWHRMGDIGFIDKKGRIWVCGRKSHRVQTAQGLLLPVQCEAIFNQHPDVARTALVGIGNFGEQRPVIIVETKADKALMRSEAKRRLINELLDIGKRHEHTRQIQDVLFHPAFPVDVRHNTKIDRKMLAEWAAKQRLG